MLYWCQNSQNHASRTSATTLILTLCHKSIHRWNPLCKGFILSHFGRVACVVQLELLGLRLCISTIGIGTTYCIEPKNYPPKRWMSATTIILPLCSKLESPMQGLHSESLWTRHVVGATLCSEHTIVRKALVKYCKRTPKGHPRR